MCRCIKNIAVFANKTLLDILLVGLNNYYTIGEHTSIAYTDLKRKIENIETAEEIEAITSLITSVAAVQMRLLIFCLQKAAALLIIYEIDTLKWKQHFE